MKVKIRVSEECNLCGLCVKYCPTDVFEVGLSGLRIHDERCIYCRGCEVLCPKKAIELHPTDEGLVIEIRKSLRGI